MKNTNKRKYLRLRTLLGLFLLCTMLLVTVRTEDYCANDNAALKEYLTETCYTGGYLLSDNTWVWYIEGNEVTKEVYVKKLAEDYDAAGWDMVQTTT